MTQRATLQYTLVTTYWDPATVGSVADETGPTTGDAVSRALLGEFASRYELVEGSLAPETLVLAETLESQYAVP